MYQILTLPQSEDDRRIPVINLPIIHKFETPFFIRHRPIAIDHHNHWMPVEPGRRGFYTADHKFLVFPSQTTAFAPDPQPQILKSGVEWDDPPFWDVLPGIDAFIAFPLPVYFNQGRDKPFLGCTYTFDGSARPFWVKFDEIGYDVPSSFCIMTGTLFAKSHESTRNVAFHTCSISDFVGFDDDTESDKEEGGSGNSSAEEDEASGSEEGQEWEDDDLGGEIDNGEELIADANAPNQADTEMGLQNDAQALDWDPFVGFQAPNGPHMVLGVIPLEPPLFPAPPPPPPPTP